MVIFGFLAARKSNFYAILVLTNKSPLHLASLDSTKSFYIREAELLDEQNNFVALATSAWLVVDIEHRGLVPARRLTG